MFNNTTNKIESPIVHVSKETIVEKTITPDKVTDMYDTIHEEVSRAYRVESNELKGVVLEINHPTRTLVTRFEINGREYVDRFPLDEGIALTNDLMLKHLRDRYAEAVANSVILEAAKFTKLR